MSGPIALALLILKRVLTYTWFSLNISAICSFSQSISFRAENANSSASPSTSCNADDRSSDIHDADPTCNRLFARVAAIFKCRKQCASSYAVQCKSVIWIEFRIIRSYHVLYSCSSGLAKAELCESLLSLSVEAVELGRDGFKSSLFWSLPNPARLGRFSTRKHVISYIHYGCLPNYYCKFLHLLTSLGLSLWEQIYPSQVLLLIAYFLSSPFLSLPSLSNV